jgi:transposase
VPPAAIRRVRDFTRARTDLVHERTRCLQRLEKLLEKPWSRSPRWRRTG